MKKTLHIVFVILLITITNIGFCTDYDSLFQKRSSSAAYYHNYISNLKDSVDIGSANSLIELDNKLIDAGKIFYDSTQVLNARLDSLDSCMAELEENAGKQSEMLLYYYIGGGVLLILMLVFLVLYFLSRAKIRKYSKESNISRQQKEQSDKQVKKLADEVEILKEGIQKERGEVNSLKSDKQSLISRLESEEKEKVEAGDNLQIVNDQLEALKSEKEEIQNRFEQSIEENNELKNNEHVFAEKLDDFKVRLQQLAEENEKLNAELEKAGKPSVDKEEKIKMLTILNSELSEANKNLSIDLEDEKAYVDKLNNKLDLYEGEIDKLEEELKELRMRAYEKMHPDSRKKLDGMEINLLKLEKLTRLKELEVISQEEFDELKMKIIDQL